MANVGTTFKFEAESAKLRAEIDKVRKEVSSLNATTKSISSGFKTLGGVVVGAFSISAITGFISKVAQAADQLNDLSGRLGASASGLQTLQIAAQQAGGSAEAMQTALGKMSVSLGNALDGSKPVNEALAKLNLNAGELAGLKADEAMRRISGALTEVGNGYERTAISQAIFGKGAVELQGFFADAPGAIGAVDAALAAAGATLDDMDVAKIGVMNDDLALQGQIVQNLGTKFTANLSPALGVATDTLAEMLAKMGGATEAGKTFGRVMTGAIKVVEAAVYGLVAAIEAVRSLISGAMSAVLMVVEKALSAMATVADAAHLDMAGPLASARDAVGGIAESMLSVSRSAEANAKAAGAAAIQAAADVFRAGEIFDAKAVEFEQRAGAAAARAGQAVQAASGGGAGAAGAKAGKADKRKDPGVSDASLYMAKLDPFADPIVQQQQGVFDALQVIRDQYAETTLGKISAFEETKLGMILQSSALQQQAEANKNATLGTAMDALVGMAISQGGRLGKIGKAIAIAQTIWSTGTAIMKAMAEVPYPANIAAAAGVAVMGVAQLANIKSTNIGSGGSIQSARGGSPAGATPSAALSDNVSGSRAETAGRTVSQVVIQGNVFSSQETAQWIIDQIRDAMDRDVVFINSNSRQALELGGA